MFNKQTLQHDHTEVVCLLPSLILGPPLSTQENSAEDLIAEILRGNYPGIPDP